MSNEESRRYIVLPALNAFNATDETPSLALSRKLAHYADPGDEDEELASLPRPVEQIDGDQASVMVMTETERLALSALYPGLQIAEEGELRMLPITGLGAGLKPEAPAGAGDRVLEITVRSAGRPLADTEVTVVFSRANGTGRGELRTDANGKVSVPLPPVLSVVDLVIVTPAAGVWPVHRERVRIKPKGTRIRLEAPAIDPAFADALSRLVSAPEAGAGRGVRVAVIDGGMSGPDTLTPDYSLNTTQQEPATLTGDNGSGHGTHVASIIRRIAPGVELYNYRVFVAGAFKAREAAIARAIRDAVDNSCDLINLSLGQPFEPIAIIREVRRARALGALCVAAAGNDFGATADYPARSSYVQAVAALGSLSAWPEKTARDLDVDRKVPPIGDVFYAAFSNRGPEIDLAMPGAGIVASVSADQLGVRSGTSMACPAAVGMIARILAEDARVLAMDRDQTRSDEIAKLAAQLALPVGFGPRIEGQGMLR